LTVHDRIQPPSEADLFAKILGDNMRAQRIRAGKQQKEIAKALGRSQQAVSKWESGDTLPGTRDLAHFAEVLNVSMHTLWMETEQEVHRRYGKVDEHTARLLEIKERLETDTLAAEIANTLNRVSPQKRELLLLFLRALTDES